MFDLDPNRPIWIVKKGGNIPVRTRGGQLYGPLVVPSAVYDVRSHPPTTAEGAATSSAGSGQLDTTYPFGAFMFPNTPKGHPCLPSFLIPHEKKGWNKTIMCYPLLDNDSTHGEAFWKSTRKVLAANTGLYKLTGQHTDLEKTRIDLTCEDTAKESDSSGTTNPELLEPLRKQPCLKYNISVNKKLE